MANSYLLLETGDRLLLETGDSILLEESTGISAQVPAAVRLFGRRVVPFALLAGSVHQVCPPRPIPSCPPPRVHAAVTNDPRRIIPGGAVYRAAPPKVAAAVAPPVPGSAPRLVHSISRYHPWVGGPVAGFFLHAPPAMVVGRRVPHPSAGSGATFRTGPQRSINIPDRIAPPVIMANGRQLPTSVRNGLVWCSPVRREEILFDDPDPTCRLGGTVTVNRLGGEVTVNRLGGKVSCE